MGVVTKVSSASVTVRTTPVSPQQCDIPLNGGRVDRWCFTVEGRQTEVLSEDVPEKPLDSLNLTWYSQSYKTYRGPIVGAMGQEFRDGENVSCKVPPNERLYQHTC